MRVSDPAEEEAAVERADQRVVDARDLVHRGAPHLADTLLDAVDPVDVRLAQQTAVRDDWR